MAWPGKPHAYVIAFHTHTKHTHTHFNGATKELKTYSITMLSVLHTEHIAKLMANKWAECNVCCNLSLIRDLFEIVNSDWFDDQRE